MSKLSFRARALDASKPLPIYRAEEIHDAAECSNINRTVPLLPTGMEKEEESETHLQQAICTGTVIPTPEVYSIDDLTILDLLYPPNYKQPRQLVYMQPFSMEADIPDYDMDSEDEEWINEHAKLELTPDKFEEMMDRLEKGSGQTVVKLQEAKALIKEDDDLIIAVYDYWLNKRLKTHHHLIPHVRTEARYGLANNNPYIAFRRRTEKMQTRKNRKNDESSYEKMLKLKRDLTRAVTLLEMVKRREKSKREVLHLSIEVFEKRYQVGDFSGSIMNEALSQRPQRPAFTPLYQTNNVAPWVKEEIPLGTNGRREKRHYKKRRHKSASKTPQPTTSVENNDVDMLTSEEERALAGLAEVKMEEPVYPFRRLPNCQYLAAKDRVSPPRLSDGEKFSFFPGAVSTEDSVRFIGLMRRRYGRGGRLIVDRSFESKRRFWESVGYGGSRMSIKKETVTSPFSRTIEPHTLESVTGEGNYLTSSPPDVFKKPYPIASSSGTISLPSSSNTPRKEESVPPIPPYFPITSLEEQRRLLLNSQGVGGEESGLEPEESSLCSRRMSVESEHNYCLSNRYLILPSFSSTTPHIPSKRKSTTAHSTYDSFTPPPPPANSTTTSFKAKPSSSANSPLVLSIGDLVASDEFSLPSSTLPSYLESEWENEILDELGWGNGLLDDGQVVEQVRRMSSSVPESDGELYKRVKRKWEGKGGGGRGRKKMVRREESDERDLKVKKESLEETKEVSQTESLVENEIFSLTDSYLGDSSSLESSELPQLPPLIFSPPPPPPEPLSELNSSKINQSNSSSKNSSNLTHNVELGQQSNPVEGERSSSAARAEAGVIIASFSNMRSVSALPGLGKIHVK